jgi:hypothetical protein
MRLISRERFGEFIHRENSNPCIGNNLINVYYFSLSDKIKKCIFLNTKDQFQNVNI